MMIEEKEPFEGLDRDFRIRFGIFIESDCLIDLGLALATLQHKVVGYSVSEDKVEIALYWYVDSNFGINYGLKKKGHVYIQLPEPLGDPVDIMREILSDWWDEALKHPTRNEKSNGIGFHYSSGWLPGKISFEDGLVSGGTAALIEQVSLYYGQ